MYLVTKTITYRICIFLSDCLSDKLPFRVYQTSSRSSFAAKSFLEFKWIFDLRRGNEALGLAVDPSVSGSLLQLQVFVWQNGCLLISRQWAEWCRTLLASAGLQTGGGCGEYPSFGSIFLPNVAFLPALSPSRLKAARFGCFLFFAALIRPAFSPLMWVLMVCVSWCRSSRRSLNDFCCSSFSPLSCV